MGDDMAAQKAYVQVNGLKKHYGDGDARLTVLDGIDTSINRGEICVMLGPSGSGKSTFLNLIGGLEDADGGSIMVDGCDLTVLKPADLGEYRRRELGFVFQFYNLMPNLTAMTGAVLQMLSHGLMTALFFALIGMIYGRTHTRDIREMGGLMKIMPFLGVCYVIAGLASLGLPGLSGFVAEMTVFVGSFEHHDTFHRVLTIAACTSIVITAVYILRVVGKLLYGKVYDQHHLTLTDAVWYERFSVVTLIVAIAGLGMMPLWVSDMIQQSLLPVIEQLTR